MVSVHSIVGHGPRSTRFSNYVSPYRHIGRMGTCGVLRSNLRGEKRSSLGGDIDPSLPHIADVFFINRMASRNSINESNDYYPPGTIILEASKYSSALTIVWPVSNKGKTLAEPMAMSSVTPFQRKIQTTL